ncbi:MAG: bacteriohopanetetrol glucosamine biosynthesis glycosyltransferase HpnI [Alphaproteobacteria bacterium]|nr:bacteriohopanetetrol glucosamine biosynthesis glycosyltransferase HpnI [Alphaproteobacteria bacterium]
MDVLSLLAWAFLVPVIGGSIYSVLQLAAVLRFFRPRDSAQHPSRVPAEPFQPPVTVLKPVCGLESGLKQRLRTACLQDYPDYQVVYSIQDPADPALPIVREIEAEFGSDRVSVVVEDIRVGPNGKVNNLLGGLRAARHDVLVISDSDVWLTPDYLAVIVAPLADPRTGMVCTPFKARGAVRWFEKMELLSYNADFIPSVIFAYLTKAADFCLGPSVALKRSTLEDMGGFESLAEYLAEDYEIGRRVTASGLVMAFPPHLVDIELDIETVSKWWSHQLYWDQNTRVANQAGFFATVFTRSVPFALLYALATGGGPVGLTVLAAALAIRLATAWATLAWGLRDPEGVRSLAWLPLRDCAGLATWALAFTKQTVIWRDTHYRLTKGGRMIAVAHRADRRHGKARSAASVAVWPRR